MSKTDLMDKCARERLYNKDIYFAEVKEHKTLRDDNIWDLNKFSIDRLTPTYDATNLAEINNKAFNLNIRAVK